jgi:hypothetical protein
MESIKVKIKVFARRAGRWFLVKGAVPMMSHSTLRAQWRWYSQFDGIPRRFQRS